MSQNPKFPDSLFQPPSPQDPSCWMATSFLLKRNLNEYVFPSKLQGLEIDQLIQKLKSAIESTEEVKGAKYYSDLAPVEKNLLHERFLVLKGFEQSPNGFGLFLDEASCNLITLNLGNHLELRTICFEPSFEGAWNNLALLENKLSGSLNFSFSPKFGYLTADPTQSGTGLTVSAYLHLPALIHSDQLETALMNAKEEGVNFMGLSGSLDELTGDIIVVQNQYSIGLTEENILHLVTQAATKLMGAEKTMRAHLKQEPTTAIKDSIAKSFGLIKHSVKLETKEALDLLSMVKLGLALGFVSGIEDQKLSSLFFQSRQGHLSHLFPDVKEMEEISQKRADLLQQEFKDAALSPDLQ